MKISHLPYFRSLEDQLYFDKMVEELKAKSPKRPPTTDQAPSTLKNLSRPKDQDFEWFNRPPPENWKAVPEAKNLDEAVAARKLDPHEVNLIESIRRRPKNSDGQSEKSSVSEERKESARQAFLYTPPAKVTKEEVERRAVNLTQIKSQPLKETWVELPWWKALIHWVRGNEIKSEKKK